MVWGSYGATDSLRLWIKVREYDEYSIRAMGTVDSKGQYRNWWMWWPGPRDSIVPV